MTAKPPSFVFAGAASAQLVCSSGPYHQQTPCRPAEAASCAFDVKLCSVGDAAARSQVLLHCALQAETLSAWSRRLRDGRYGSCSWSKPRARVTIFALLLLAPHSAVADQHAPCRSA